MSNVIYGNMVGGGSAPLKTLILTDENGNEVVGVVTESVQAFNATPADVIVGKTFVSDEGIKVGENTKTYRVTKASEIILPGMNYSILLNYYDAYDYTKFQCMISKFNTSFSDSVDTNKISLENNVYEVNSTEVLSKVTKNADTKSVDLNIVNDTSNIYIVHFFTYKEEY